MFAVLHVADFALQAVLRLEAAAALAQPAALFATSSKKSILLAVNAAARAQGVEVGMTAPQAVARCPTLLIRTPVVAAETEARTALLTIGFSLSPAIEDTAPGICTIDLRGNGQALEPLAQSAVQQLAALGLFATAGLARTPLLALYAARSIEPALSNSAHERDHLFACAESPPLDLFAADPSATPNVFAVTDERLFLAPLPLSAADPSSELAHVLAAWGLRTLGDLTSLPRDDIVRRFGAEGLALWQRAAGGSPRPLHPVAPPQHFQAAMEFEDAIETLEPLLFILRRFLDRLALELTTAQLVAVELELALRLEDETRHTRSFRLPEPTADVEILFRALHTHLESLQTAAAIVAVDLVVTPTRPLVRQQGLFETGLRDPHGFAETLARLSALVGNDRVGTPQLENSHRPDAVKLVTPASVVPPAAEPPTHSPLGLPLRRFRPPLPAQLEFTDNRPTYVFSEKVRGEVVGRSVAWVSSGEWWQADRAWARSEWDFALSNGGLYRIVLVGERYFIEGEYD